MLCFPQHTYSQLLLAFDLHGLKTISRFIQVHVQNALSKATFRWLIRCLLAILRALPCITTYHYAQHVLSEFGDRQMVSCLQPTRLYYVSSHHEKKVRTLMFRHFYTIHISNTLYWNPYLSWYHICAYCFILFIKQT